MIKKHKQNTQHWWGHTWSDVSSSWLPGKRETWTFWRDSNKRSQRWWKDWSMSYIRKGRESWDFQPGEEKAQGFLYINSWREGTEDGTRLFSVGSSDKTRGSGHKLKHRRFPQNIGTFYHEGGWELPQVVQGGYGVSLSLQILKSSLDMVLCPWL